MLEAFISLIAATALLLGSPGPAPLALAGTAATYGIKKSVPFLLGILAGLSATILAAMLGLSALFTTFPSVQFIAQIIGALYICFIAYKIATAPVISDNNHLTAPKFRDGFILNLINPKAYAAFLALFSQFLLPLTDTITSYALTGLTCLIVATIVDTLWLCLGGLLKPIFSHPLQARVIRIVFAILMVSAVLLTFLATI